MKITIVFPKFPFSERFPVVPPILEYLAALTRREDESVEVELIDANQMIANPADINTDIVAISTLTVTAPWAYDFADACRMRGLPVILGGIHPTILPNEASLHADSVVIGEAESVWGEVLKDAAKGNLKRFYTGERLELNGLPTPIDGSLKGNYRFRAFFTMRGCPYSCTFCCVPRCYGEIIRYRPVSEVAAEIEKRAGRIWFNGDDSVWGGDINRSIELFNQLSQGSKKFWFGFGDLKSIWEPRGEELLKAARQSGLFSIMTGWESSSTKILSDYKAIDKQGHDRIEAIRRLQGHGIYVVLFVVLGGRKDSIDSFKRTIEIADKLNVGLHPFLLMPLPGTMLFEEYEEHFLSGINWSDFTGMRALFRHPDPEMTPLKREEEYHKLRTKLFCTNRILKRVLKMPISSFPSNLMAFMKELPMKKQIFSSYKEWVNLNSTQR